MIIDRKRKLAIFLNPKTGTTTLLDVLRSQKLDVFDHGHENLSEAEEIYGSLSGYKKFCFYRNPLDRTRSILRQFPQLPIDYYLPRLLAEKNQIYWLNHSDIEYLNYDNFDAEIQRLCRYLNIELDDIPQLNKSFDNEQIDQIIDKNWDIIQSYLEIDYKFIDSIS